MIRLVVFDFDGTLVDTKHMLLSIIRQYMNKPEYTLSKKILSEFGDYPLERVLEAIGVEEKVLPYFVDKIEFSFVEHARRVKPCKHIKKLAGIKQSKIILSNSLSRYIQEVLKYHHLTFFDSVYGSDQFSTKRAMFEVILKKYSLKPSEVLYVGDRPVDVRLARAVGCRVVIVAGPCSWSSPQRIFQAQPDFVVKDLGELPLIITRLDSS